MLQIRERPAKIPGKQIRVHVWTRSIFIYFNKEELAQVEKYLFLINGLAFQVMVLNSEMEWDGDLYNICQANFGLPFSRVASFLEQHSVIINNDKAPNP